MSEQFMIMGPGEYRTRGGEKAIVDEVIGVAEAKTNEWEYCADGSASGIEWMWYRNGRLFKDETSEYDIVGPWVESAQKAEEPKPAEVLPEPPPGLVYDERGMFSDAPKTTNQRVNKAFDEFRARLNQIYNDRVISLVASVRVDAGDKESLTLFHYGPFSSAIGATEWMKSRLIEEMERA